ncbi:hypothetical protein PIB30_103994, partial [Stylosanthes scabra]|nr:hypothetical protein [Stylosanthes scabra]
MVPECFPRVTSARVRTRQGTAEGSGTHKGAYRGRGGAKHPGSFGRMQQRPQRRGATQGRDWAMSAGAKKLRHCQVADARIRKPLDLGKYTESYQ